MLAKLKCIVLNFRFGVHKKFSFVNLVINQFFWFSWVSLIYFCKVLMAVAISSSSSSWQLVDSAFQCSPDQNWLFQDPEDCSRYRTVPGRVLLQVKDYSSQKSVPVRGLYQVECCSRQNAVPGRILLRQHIFPDGDVEEFHIDCFSRQVIVPGRILFQVGDCSRLKTVPGRGLFQVEYCSRRILFQENTVLGRIVLQEETSSR